MRFKRVPLAKSSLVSLFVTSAMLVSLVAYVVLASDRDERSMEEMVAWITLLEQIHQAEMHFVRAGDLVRGVQQSGKPLEELGREIAQLEGDFSRIKGQIALWSPRIGTERFADFARQGDRFYGQLTELQNRIKKIVESSVREHGVIMPIYEMIHERQLLHYKYVNQLVVRVWKGEQFNESAEYEKCILFFDGSHDDLILDPELRAMLAAVEPLHKQLHLSASAADDAIRRGDGEGALREMGRGLSAMTLLDSRLAYIEKQAHEKYHMAVTGFLEQREAVMALHGELAGILQEWVKLVKTDELPATEQRMRDALEKNSRMLVTAGVLIVLLAFLGCLLNRRKDAFAIQAGRESQRALEESLEKQRQLIVNLEKEIERRKKVEDDLHRVNKELEDMAVTDGLTGLYNHRFMKQFLHLEHSRAVRHGHDLSVIMIDIDFFKKVNDEYGHGCGDVVLLGIGEILQQRVRSTDMIARFDVDQAVVARYGGEEMAIILPETPLGGAAGLAEDLRRMIENYTFYCEEVKINVTVSIGVAASQKERSETWSSLLGRADAALYRAKNNGRNRVECFA